MIRVIISSIESVLKDLQFFYMNIEDVLQESPESGHIVFNPDISIPFTIISHYIDKQTHVL